MLRLLAVALEFLYRLFVRSEPPPPPPSFVHKERRDWSLDDLHRAQRDEPHWDEGDKNDPRKSAATYVWSGVSCASCGRKRMIDGEDTVMQRTHCIATFFEQKTNA